MNAASKCGYIIDVLVSRRKTFCADFCRSLALNLMVVIAGNWNFLFSRVASCNVQRVVRQTFLISILPLNSPKDNRKGVEDQQKLNKFNSYQSASSESSFCSVSVRQK